ncbi:MAG TPA: hypothetical protein VF161_12755 [Steroidobacteraceae bacterium]|jgi:hypothetical protein
MEFLLLWADELDDALAMLRHLAPRILGLLLALGLFLATGFALLLAPQVVLPALALALSFLLIIESVRRRRARVSTGN